MTAGDKTERIYPARGAGYMHPPLKSDLDPHQLRTFLGALESQPAQQEAQLSPRDRAMRRVS